MTMEWDTWEREDKPGEWVVPVPWKMLLSALALEVAGLDSLDPERRTTESFLQGLETALEIGPPSVPILTLDNEEIARTLARTFRQHVQEIQNRV